MQERYRNMEAMSSAKKIFAENDRSVTDIASFECYEYINNSFSAAKETESIENSANKENMQNENWLRKSFLSNISEKEENNSHIYGDSPSKFK
jgi:hypothetical protein